MDVYTLNHCSHLGDHIYVFATEEAAIHQAAYFILEGIQDPSDRYKFDGDDYLRQEAFFKELRNLFEEKKYVDLVDLYYRLGDEFCGVMIFTETEGVLTEAFDPTPGKDEDVDEEERCGDCAASD